MTEPSNTAGLTAGRIVHYVSHGSPVKDDGTQTFESVCRPAMITEVGQWVTVETTEITPGDSFSHSDGDRPVRELIQWHYNDSVTLAVINPTGIFFSGSAATCKHDEGDQNGRRAPGSWHWPERS